MAFTLISDLCRCYKCRSLEEGRSSEERVAELQILPPLTRAREMPRVTPTERTQQSTVSTLVVGAQWGVLSSQGEVVRLRRGIQSALRILTARHSHPRSP